MPGPDSSCVPASAADAHLDLKAAAYTSVAAGSGMHGSLIRRGNVEGVPHHDRTRVAGPEHVPLERTLLFCRDADALVTQMKSCRYLLTPRGR